MAAPDLNRLDSPVGPLRDKRTIALTGQNYVRPGGFICQVASAGNLTYRTISGDEDQTETGLSIGDAIEVAGVPVVLIAIRASSSVSSVVIGII